MIIIVDANILFSAVVTPNGKIAQILNYPFLNVKRVSCHYITVELHRHRLKIAQITKKSEERVIDDIQHYLKFLNIYDELFFEKKFLKEAKRLTEGVDLFDLDYVALTLQTGGILWTGDKKLTAHLLSMNFNNIINTTDLYELLRIG